MGSRIVVAILWMLTLAAVPASAQIDLTGSWNSRMHEDWFLRGPGQDLADYTGLPLSDEARAIALSYEATVVAMRERQCLPYSPYAFSIQPGGFSMWSEYDSSGRIIAWKTAAQTIRMSLTIWMDGRPHPSPNAYSDFTGFTTGKWEGDTLTTYTTNLKTYTRRRGAGVPGSDQTTITAHFTRHDNLLTVVTIEEDPIYLTEPNVVSRTWELDPRGNIPPFTRCEAVTEIARLEDSGIVPHQLPGENAQEHFIATTYGIPQDAAMGHAETLYPEYRKKMRGTYKAPAQCTRYCCGWLGFEGLPDSAPGLKCIIGGGYGALDKEVAKSQKVDK
jgi:hypothetical protein